MIIIRTTKMHLQKTQYKRISSTSFIFVSCLRTFSYYPSISPEKCPKCLSFLRFRCFAFIIISARSFSSCIDVIFLPNVRIFFFVFGIYIFSTVFCIVCQIDAMHGYIKYQGSVSIQILKFIR